MSATFAWGVASFDPLADRVLLWTRLGAGATEAHWVVARDAACTDVVAEGDATTSGDVDHTITVDVDGLEPATTYHYRFEAAGERSNVGRTRTLPVGPVAQLRIGDVCCARFTEAHFTVYRALAARPVDLVIHLGDYIYEDGKERGAKRPLDTPGVVHDLAGYRSRYAQHHGDPDLIALHAAHPVAVIWDDHEFSDNAWSGGANGHDPAAHGAWADRRAAAIQAHHEHVPVRLRNDDDPVTMWRSLVLGDLAEIVLTETRMAGRDEPAGIDDPDSVHDPDRSLLGDAQRAWLVDTVRASTARWLVMASGTVVSELALPVPGHSDHLLPEKYAICDGEAINTDQWDGYPAERARLADLVRDRATPLVVLSGDIHSAWAIEGEAWVEAVCPPAATAPFGHLVPVAAQAVAKVYDATLDHVRWVDVDHHGFVELDITAERVEIAWYGVDLADDPVDDGEVATEPLARFQVVPGPPTLTRVDRRRHRRLLTVGGVAAGVVAAGVGVFRRARPRP